ncbi:MAG: HAMP domain-containing sensor histidine kinase [Chitinophagaceae bacterium]
MKTRNRIILLLSSIIVGIILLFSGFMYVFISNFAFTDFYERLETRANYAARIRLDPDNLHLTRFKTNYLVKLPREKDDFLQIDAAHSLRYWAEKDGFDQHFLETVWEKGKGTFRKGKLLFCGIRHKAYNGATYIVITSAENDYFDDLMSYLSRLLFVMIIASTIIIFFLSSWLFKKIFRPIKMITEDVLRIGTENLNIRLSDPGTDDELGSLTRTMNGMLDRLETSFETQNNFISNASHELNTPLTTIIGEADIALARPRSQEEYVLALQHILAEAEKLDRKTKALLHLAQTGLRGKQLIFEKVRIDQLLFDVQDTVKRIYPQSKVRFDYESLPDNPRKLKARGNEQLLHLAFSNIILNACKYSHNDLVNVSIACSERYVAVVVKDRGIGIPVAEIDHIYDPFFRASNTTPFEGYGIGLPLTRNIVKMHEGEMIVTSEVNAGTTVEVKLPRFFTD